MTITILKILALLFAAFGVLCFVPLAIVVAYGTVITCRVLGKHLRGEAQSRVKEINEEKGVGRPWDIPIIDDVKPIKNEEKHYQAGQDY